MDTASWIYPRPEGLYVAPGDFFIDPSRPVPRAVVSHAHSDHARPGLMEVRATAATLGIMRVRYRGAAPQMPQPVGYGEAWEWGGVRISLAPAGHVLGSAQVVLEYRGTRVVYSGDYKRVPDPTCAPFTVVPCDVFITEATFGLPVFRHPLIGGEVEKLRRSMALFPERSHVIGVYSLGKAQRLLCLLREAGEDRPVYIHGALQALCDYYAGEGIALGELRPATVAAREELRQALVLAPPSAVREPWARRLHDPVVGFASGWMGIRQRARQQNAELPLVISDHADWPDLLRTIRETGAREIWVTHGQEDALVHQCRLGGLTARPLTLVREADGED
ncbi:MAG: ligase-associated DNA damage response exonuclease [Candidatus Methylacidiphilales bacterium]|nr:ligase-associated DNA damage response exonuclease [Candidatus Methylacidiphilales bacterium]